jgi:hypothetical protein
MGKPPADPAEQLRELIREANGVVKDLSRLLREYKQLTADPVKQLTDAMTEAARDQMRRADREIQQSINQSSADLNKAVARAREIIMKQLTLSTLEIVNDEAGQPMEMRVKWANEGAFNEHAELPK